MPQGLKPYYDKRYYAAHDLHFITSSCYRRQALFGIAAICCSSFSNKSGNAIHRTEGGAWPRLCG
jgi:hypothetical protein